MANNYIVTAQKPTAVSACVTGIHNVNRFFFSFVKNSKVQFSFNLQ